MNSISKCILNCRGLILFAALAVAVSAQSRYHVIKKIPVPGDYGWDYLTADIGSSSQPWRPGTPMADIVPWQK
jgi:hypothetical protein